MLNQIKAFLDASDYSSKSDEILDLIRPSARIRPQPHQVTSKSFLGGVPLLPPGFAYPTYNINDLLAQLPKSDPRRDEANQFYRGPQRQGLLAAKNHGSGEVELNFVAQIFLDEVPTVPGMAQLTREGSLLFFAALEENMIMWGERLVGPWSVLYLAPDLLKNLVSVNPTSALTFLKTTVDFESEIVYEISEHTERKHGELERDGIDTGQLIQDLKCNFGLIIPGDYSNGPEHRLLGAPAVIHDKFLERECQEKWIASLSDSEVLEMTDNSERDWQLLLQIDDDYHLDKSLGYDHKARNLSWESGCAKISFWILKQDLAQCDFSRACCIYQILG